MLPADLDLGVRAGGGGSRVWFKREGREIVLERDTLRLKLAYSL
jgi:hypothetical protein